MLCSVLLISSLACQRSGNVPAIDPKFDVQTNGATVTRDGEKYVVDFQLVRYPMIMFTPSEARDWSAYGKFTMTVSNPGAQPVDFLVRLDDGDDHSGDGAISAYGSGTIEAGHTENFAFALGPVAHDNHFMGLPVVSGQRWLRRAGKQIQYNHITRLTVNLLNPVRTATLTLGPPTLIPGPAFPSGMLDEFGQSTQLDWPDKVKSLDDVKTQLAADADDVRQNPKPSDRDQYGGSTDLPKLNATGRFRTEKVDGRWWFVDPDGAPFISLGLNQVAADEPTVVDGREKLVGMESSDLSGLKLQRAGKGPHPDASAIDFREDTLERIYGPSFRDGQISRALDRMLSWGFNTIGNWTSSVVWLQRKLPYVATAQTINGDFDKLNTGSGGWGRMPDVFDPRYEQSVRECIKPRYNLALGDPWCLGWYIDNELSWHQGDAYSIPLDGLKKDGSSPIKAAFVEELKRRYTDAAKLGEAWKVSYSSWDDVAMPLSDAAKPLEADLAALLDLYADKYFSIVSTMLKSADPQALYLGCRFNNYTPRLAKIAAKYCDAVSFNLYAPEIDPAKWAFTNDLGKPCLVSEWHFGAQDTGYCGGIATVKTQAERAEGYERYVTSMMKMPAFVGCHWFEYNDEPLLGRPSDGENYNDGFVNECDVPYRELVKSARRTNLSIYKMR